MTFDAQCDLVDERLDTLLSLTEGDTFCLVAPESDRLVPGPTGRPIRENTDGFLLALTVTRHGGQPAGTPFEYMTNGYRYVVGHDEHGDKWHVSCSYERDGTVNRLELGVERPSVDKDNWRTVSENIVELAPTSPESV